MAKVGRKTKMTDVTIGKLEEAFANGANDTEACFIAGISKDTLYNYQEKHPEFADRKEALKRMPVYEARVAVRMHQKRDGDLALKHLERKAKDEYSLRHELTGAEGKDFTFKWVEGEDDTKDA